MLPNLGSNSVFGGLGLSVAQEGQVEVENPFAHAMYDGVVW